jgi:hypothetical protein
MAKMRAVRQREVKILRLDGGCDCGVEREKRMREDGPIRRIRDLRRGMMQEKY